MHHRFCQPDDLLIVQAVKIDHHQQRRCLVIRDIVRGDPADEMADPGLRQRLLMTCAVNQILARGKVVEEPYKCAPSLQCR